MWAGPTSQASAAAAMLQSGASAGHLSQFEGLSSSENAKNPARNPHSGHVSANSFGAFQRDSIWAVAVRRQRGLLVAVCGSQQQRERQKPCA